VFDLESGEIDLVLPVVFSVTKEVQNPIQQINWSPDGAKLALAVNYNLVQPVETHDHHLQVYDGSSGELLLDLDSQGEIAVDWSPDGKRLLTGGENGTVRIWDTQTGETLRELPSEDGWSTVVMWSPEGETLAVGYYSGVIKLWDTRSWTVKSIFTGHQGPIWDLNWSPNGERIISCDTDNNVALIWEPTSGEIVTTWDMKGLVIGGLGNVDWSPDGRSILLEGEGDMPFLRRAWQSTEEVIDYAYECCVWRELTPGEREQFGLPEKP
jgi:WD40 repeat protein